MGDNEEKIINFKKKPQNFLVLLGPPGVGKTYFCAALIDWATELDNQNFRFEVIKRISEDRLFEDLRNVENGDYVGKLRNIMNADLFIYDDLGSVGVTDWRREVVMTMLNERCESLGFNRVRPMIICSNLTKKQIREIYDERIYSRLFDLKNTVIELFDMPDKRLGGI